jgi:hypothetical protein
MSVTFDMSAMRMKESDAPVSATASAFDFVATVIGLRDPDDTELATCIGALCVGDINAFAAIEIGVRSKVLECA